MKNVLKKGFLALIFAVFFATIIPTVLPNNIGMENVEAATIKLSSTKATLIKGQTKKLKIKGTSAKVTWKSSNKSVATVNSNGKVTALKKGTAKITAKVKGKKYTCKITVENPKLNKTSATIAKGDTLKLKVKGTSQTVKWKSNKKSVATVNSNGKVTAKKKGTATITATVGGKTKYKCKVTVVKPGTLTVASTSVTVNESSTQKVNVTLVGADTVTYKIADTSIVSCEWGKWSGDTISLKIKGLKPGTTTITIKNNVSSDKCKIKVTVKSKAYATLKSFMTSKGSKTSDGKYKYVYKYNNAESVTVLYNKSNDKYTFTAEDTSSGISCEMTFGESTETITPIYKEERFEATTTLYKSTYKYGNSLTFSFSKNTSGLSSSNSSVQGLANNAVKLDFLLAEEFLKKKVGTSLYDLGFVRIGL